MKGTALVVASSTAQRDWLCALIRRARPLLVPSIHDFSTAALPPVPIDLHLLLVDMDGIGGRAHQRLLAYLQRQQFAGKTLLFSTQLDDALLEQALVEGMAGYLLKSQPQDILLKLLTHQQPTQPLYAPEVWQLLLTRLRVPALRNALTQRERDVLACIGKGLNANQAAAKLSLAPGTVSSYIKQLYRKLGINNRAQAAKMALQLRLAETRDGT